MIKRFTLFSLLVLFSVSANANLAFKEHTIQTDIKITHPIFSAQLLEGKEKQLIVFGVNEEKDRILALYQYEPTMEPKFQLLQEFLIPREFIAFDLLKGANQDKLLFQSNRAVFQLDTSNKKIVHLFDAPSIYLPETADFLNNRDFVKDVNGDKLDDVIIADFLAINIFIQTPSGEFNRQTLPITSKMELENQSIVYRERPVYFADFDMDQKTDLITVVDKGFQFYPQINNGLFADKPLSLQTDIDFKALNWWEVRDADGEQLDQSNLAYRTVSEIEDINNDKIPDLMIRHSQTSGVLDRKNNYEVYLGKLNDNRLTFAEKPDSVIEVDGTTVSVELIDFNNNGRSEILLSSLDIGVTQIIGALLSGSIDQDVYIFELDKNSRYKKEPETSKEVALNFSLSSGQRGQSVVSTGDFDGDKKTDLLLSSGSKMLKIFRGDNDKRMLMRRSERIKITLPKDGAMVEVDDLNQDGKDDIILRFGRQDEPEKRNQIIILISG